MYSLLSKTTPTTKMVKRIKSVFMVDRRFWENNTFKRCRIKRAYILVLKGIFQRNTARMID